MNGYKFDFAVSANISAKVVEDMVKRVVEEQTGKKVMRIEMKVSAVSRGIGPAESTEHAFTGCTVYFENEKSGADAKGFQKTTY